MWLISLNHKKVWVLTWCCSDFVPLRPGNLFVAIIDAKKISFEPVLSAATNFSELNKKFRTIEKLCNIKKLKKINKW